MVSFALWGNVPVTAALPETVPCSETVLAAAAVNSSQYSSISPIFTGTAFRWLR